MEQPLHAMPRRDDDDEIEGELSYLPGSGPSLDPDYFDPHAAPPGFVTAFWNPYEVKHRRRTSRAQLSVLESEFDNDPKPNADKRRSLAAQLNMTPRAIQVWFQNRRAKIKAIKHKIPGGRGMPKLKPGEKAAMRANRNVGDEKTDTADWVELSPEESPLTSPGDGAFSPDPKPQVTIAVPDNVSPGPPSAASEAPSPALTAQNDLLAPPSAAAMLRRGSAPAPLQGIHRARYGVFNRPNEDTIPASPISPPDHQVAPVRRASASHVGLGRRPSLPDSHLRLPAHPYYPHASAPRMQRRGGLLSPVPDVGQEQEHAPYNQLPVRLPPAPTVGSSRLYRALPPGMGAVPAAHDLPTQFPARPGVYGSSSGSYAPARPFAVPVAGPLPAPDFSFGAPEPGHGDAFNRAMADHEPAPVSATSEYGPDFNQPEYPSEYEYQSHSNPDFSNALWDRTRFGSMASIASDVTGVSVSSTQATSISSSGDRLFGYPGGFQPDVRRASCPGEFLHQFSGMGVGPNQNDSVAGPTPIRPSPLGRSLTIAPDSRLVQDAKSLHSPTFPPGHVDPTFPPPPPQEHGRVMSNGQHMGSNSHLPSGQHVSSAGQHMPSNGQHMPSNNQHMSSNGQLHMSPTEMPSNQHQRSLVGGGFGSESYIGYDSRTPPSFEASPNMAGVDVLGSVDMMGNGNIDMMNNGVDMMGNNASVGVVGNNANLDMMGNGAMGNMPTKEPMLFNADGPYDLSVMPMISQGYTGDFTF